MAKKPGPFHFQKFSIKHDRCAHKVGTDGILLGSWLNPDIANASILDFGSGSGLISLILAQRFPASKILGLEIDKNSWEQAEENRLDSPFAAQIKFENKDLLEYDNSEKFDLIVSNPPYFTNGIKAPKSERARARHIENEVFRLWLNKLNELLKTNGKLALILPPDLWQQEQEYLEQIGFHPQRLCRVRHDSKSSIVRILVELSHEEEVNPIEEELCLYHLTHKHQKSAEFQTLVQNLML